MKNQESKCVHCNDSGMIVKGETVRISTPCFYCTTHAVKKIQEKFPDLIMAQEYEKFQALLYKHLGSADSFREVMNALLRAIPIVTTKTNI